MINSNEEVVNRYRYTPYGESEVKEEQVYNPYQYTGRRYDEESGLYYYRARMYSPEQKRFTSSDPAGMMAGPNRYAYAGNNPINARDPIGMFPSDFGPMIDGAGGRSVKITFEEEDSSKSGGSSSSNGPSSTLKISYTSYEIDVNECPNGNFDSFTQCVNHWAENFPEYDSPAETCKDICYGYDHSGIDFDYSKFWSCLFPTRSSWESGAVWLSHGLCAAAIVGTAITSGGGAVTIASACASSTYRVAQCIDEAS